jgi:hypothetical protein
MPIFYRSDTRKPSIIFKDGFKPKIQLHASAWISHALRTNKNENSSIDINDRYAVSLTRRFESAPIFPADIKLIDLSEIYIYAISIPNKDIPQDNTEIDNNIAYDLHKLQIQNIAKIMERDFGDRMNIGYVGSTLCAFESFAARVDPENILCAIKCSRSQHLPLHAFNIIYGNISYAMINLDRRFLAHNTIFYNDNFNCSTQDRTEDAIYLLNKYCDVANKTFDTTTVSFALGGTTFALPTQELLVNFCLRQNNYDAAIYIVLMSVWCAIITSMLIFYRSITRLIMDKTVTLVAIDIPTVHKTTLELTQLIQPNMENQQKKHNNDLLKSLIFGPTVKQPQKLLSRVQSSEQLTKPSIARLRRNSI